MFQVGDIVTCINCSEETGYYYTLPGQYKVPISDDCLLLTLGENYRNLELLKNYTVLRDCSCDDEILKAFEIRILNRNMHLDTPQIISLVEFPDKIFIAERFILNLKATRKVKIEEILS